MSEANPQNTTIKVQEGVYNTAEFEAYVFWYSIPSMLLRPPSDRQGVRPTTDQMLEALGIDDERVREFAGIKTQQQFAERFGLDRATLTNWNKIIAKRDTLADLRVFFRGLSKNIMLAMYNLAMNTKAPNSDRAQLNFMKIIAEFNEKTTVDHNLSENFFDGLKHALALPEHGNNGNGDQPKSPDAQASIGAGADGAPVVL